MITMDLALKALCLWFCMTSALGGTSEEMARDFIEQVLRVPNPNRVLNSVLGRLQRKQEIESQQQMYDEDCEEPPQVLPEYTESLQESRERDLRELSSQVSQKHYPICHLKRILRKLNTNEYEYRPAYYEEVRCSSTENVGTSNEICSSLGFSCIQWNKTIHLTRRRYSSDCWETRMMVIPAGCECMWPVHKLGDMALHQ